MKLEPELDAEDKVEYKVKAIKDSTVYATEAIGQLLELYYLVFLKSYSEAKSTWESASTVM